MPEETAFSLTEEAGILTLTMSAPGNNLMTGAFFREYEAIMDQVQLRSTQPGIRGLIIRSGGRHFSVGADVDALAERSAAESFDGKRLPPAHCKQKRHFTFLRSLPFPVVSVVTGFCIGSGSEIAVNCHYRICEKTPGWDSRSPPLASCLPWEGLHAPLSCAACPTPTGWSCPEN